MDKVVCLVVRIRPGARLPVYKSDASSGMDLAAEFSVDSGRSLPAGGVIIGVGRIVTIGTGISIDIPPGYEGQVRPRSGLASPTACFQSSTGPRPTGTGSQRLRSCCGAATAS